MCRLKYRHSKQQLLTQLQLDGRWQKTFTKGFITKRRCYWDNVIGSLNYAIKGPLLADSLKCPSHSLKKRQNRRRGTVVQSVLRKFCIQNQKSTIRARITAEHFKVAVTKLHTSRPQKQFTPAPHWPKSTLRYCQLRYAANSEPSSRALAPLFALQRCTTFLWPWSIQFVDAYNSVRRKIRKQ